MVSKTVLHTRYGVCLVCRSLLAAVPVRDVATGGEVALPPAALAVQMTIGLPEHGPAREGDPGTHCLPRAGEREGQRDAQRCDAARRLVLK